MKRVIFYSIVLLGLVACGGGGSTGGGAGGGGAAGGGAAGGGAASSLMDPSSIDLVQDIADGKVVGFDSTDPIENQYLAIVNYLRSLRVKCNDPARLQGPAGGSLSWSDLLENAAQEHSNDMLANKKMQHEGSGTATDLTGVALGHASDPGERIKHNEYDSLMSSENIAYVAAYPSLSNDAWLSAMEGWMTSTTGHCSNIMNPNFVDFGMVEARGKHDVTFADGVTRNAEVAYWTQNFGKPK